MTESARQHLCLVCGQLCTTDDWLCPCCRSAMASSDRTLAIPAPLYPATGRLSPKIGAAAYRTQIVFVINGLALALPPKACLVVGRQAVDAHVSPPDVDLTPFGAVEKGVSRRHLQLKRPADLTYVADLKSSNGTWLNDSPLLGERLLRDGDVLRLGQLTITVQFH